MQAEQTDTVKTNGIHRRLSVETGIFQPESSTFRWEIRLAVFPIGTLGPMV